VLDADVDGDRPYIVSEYVPGPSLNQLVASESPRSGADLERLAVGTLTALVAIHQAGIVHRDFKPQNVLIGPDGPRVIDFGIARALDAAATMTNSAIGTPAYMAPEQLMAKEITPATDVFSWASTMVYAATGQSPFGQDTVMAVIHRIISEPPDLGSMEEPLRGIVADCLAKDPAARPGTQELLMRVLGKEGVTPAGPAATDPQTAMMGQGAALAGDVPPTVPTAAATTAAGTVTGRRLSSRTIAAALAGLLIAAGVATVVIWAAARGGGSPSSVPQQTPAPSSEPASSVAPRQPTGPTHHRQSSSVPTGNDRTRPQDSAPATHPTDDTTAPGGGTTEPGGGTTEPGGGNTTQPAGGGSLPAANSTW
jgi:serine/threonine protein kinase